MAADLLYEIGVEEIPADVVLPALEQLQQAVAAGLSQLRLSHGQISIYGTPRRLAIRVEAVAERQEDSTEQIKGPPVQTAFDSEGNPTEAATGFARSRRVDVGTLEVRTTDKGEFVFSQVHQPGKPATLLLPDLLRQATENLTFPKTMRWGTADFRFARPVRWLVALLGSEVLDLEIASVRAGKVTRGHRTLGAGSVEIPTPDAYERLLEANGVIANHRRRREMIVEQATELVTAQGHRPRIDPDVLTEVNFLVEYPTCVKGNFSPDYLKLPEEVIVTVLQGHQKAFAIEDETGALTASFIATTNADPAAADTVRAGWEKVIVPRLADAQFYYARDMDKPLHARLEELKRVTFMGKLGNLYDKTQRLGQLVDWLAEYISDIRPEEAQTAQQAAKLAKCDQITLMVRDGKLGEALEGIIGGYYATASGEPEAVAEAIAQQYLPNQPGDPIPQSAAGRLLGISDKMDNVAACFSLGKIPSGSADPYALRRQAAGIIEIAAQSNYHFSLHGLIKQALALLPQTEQIPDALAATEAIDKLVGFFAERLQAAWEQQGVDYDICRAVLGSDWDDIADATRRALFLSKLRQNEPEAFDRLVTAAERPARITRPEDIPEDLEVNQTLFDHPLESQLAQEFAATEQQVGALLSADSPDYAQAAQQMRALLPTIHQYFEDVMVMVDDEALRHNRLALMRRIDQLFLHLADFVEIVPANQ